ncbi:MAG: signal recognition particle protein [bacterium]
MFDSLTSSLESVFKKLRGFGRLTEANIRDSMREVRMALLEADVNYEVARDFVTRVSEQCIGEEVLHSISPGQQVVKRVHDELVKLLGAGQNRRLELNPLPAPVMLVGLHGSGKTTTSAKLAAVWKKDGKNVLLVGADIRRPAAVDQLGVLAKQIGVDMLAPERGETVPALGRRAMDLAELKGRDVVLFDTGGRFQIDGELVQELKDLRQTVNCRNTILVVDAAIGQESVHVADAFHKALDLRGLILTKLDGDARGGAALSIQSVTGCPILFTGVGERVGELEPFYPERMASRILGMGDIVGLVERAQETVNLTQVADMEKKLRKNRLDLEDFLSQLMQLRKMGSMDSLIEMLPMGGQVKAKLREAGKGGDFARSTKRAEAIIQSMTLKERRRPELLNASRKRRIAAGSGTQVQDVNEVLKQFEQTREMAKRMGSMQKRLRGR